MATSTWAVFVDAMPRSPSPALLELIHEANPRLAEGEVQALLSERSPQIAAGLSREQANALMTQLLAINVPVRKQEVFNVLIKDEPDRASPEESRSLNPTAMFTAPRGGSRALSQLSIALYLAACLMPSIRIDGASHDGWFAFVAAVYYLPFIVIVLRADFDPDLVLSLLLAVSSIAANMIYWITQTAIYWATQTALIRGARWRRFNSGSYPKFYAGLLITICIATILLSVQRPTPLVAPRIGYWVWLAALALGGSAVRLEGRAPRKAGAYPG